MRFQAVVGLSGKGKKEGRIHRRPSPWGWGFEARGENILAKKDPLEPMVAVAPVVAEEKKGGIHILRFLYIKKGGRSQLEERERERVGN